MEEVIKKHYELTYIVPMSYTVDEVPEVNKTVTDLLIKNGAENIKETSLGKLKFAYPINKMSHGYYQVVEFDLGPEAIKEVDSALKLMDSILRFIIVSKKLKTEEELAAEQRLREKIAEQEAQRVSIFDEEDDDVTKKKPKKKAPTTQPEKEKVNVEDLDKRLDSILEGKDMLQ